MNYDLGVIGLGYVGLPLAIEAARRGLSVVGFDVSASTVLSLNSGRSHIDDVSNDDLTAVLGLQFVASDDQKVLSDCSAIVICVPTPLKAEGSPDLTFVESAAQTVSQNISKGTLVVLESTTYPGTTEEVVKPILDKSGLELGRDYWLAYSPERVDPGNATFNIWNTPKVVGGCDPESLSRACSLYSAFISTVVPTNGTREAEMAKLLENTYRNINIALMNEMLIFSHELGIDLWEVIRVASTKPFGFQAFYPGPGVGGHCIPIDPNYLSYKVRTLGYPFRFVELAQEVSGRMPSYVVDRVTELLNEMEKSVRNSKILLLGVSYKPNISDQRESPALEIGRHLSERGAHVRYSDPHVPEWTIGDKKLISNDDVTSSVGEADLVILLQNHDAFDWGEILAHSSLILDTRGVLVGENVTKL